LKKERKQLELKEEKRNVIAKRYFSINVVRKISVLIN